MNRMSELREERGISMKDVANQLGIPYTTYVNYEKGLREPNSEMLIKIAYFYNTSIDYLLCNDTALANKVLEHDMTSDMQHSEDETISSGGAPSEANPDIRMIARAGKKMTPEQAENLRKYAEFMFPEAFKDDKE